MSSTVNFPVEGIAVVLKSLLIIRLALFIIKSENNNVQNKIVRGSINYYVELFVSSGKPTGF